MSRQQRSGSRRSVAAIVIACASVLLASVLAARPADPKSGLQPVAVAPYAQGGESPTASQRTGIVEIRVYTIKAGMMDAFVKWMEKADKFQESVGMRILGHFADPVQNRYVWIRLYPDEATRQRLYKAVYESREWKEQFGGAREAGFERSDVFLAKPTKYSMLQYDWAQWAFKGGPPPTANPGVANLILYEIRIYSVKPGRMDTFVKWMGEKMIPWQETKGLRILGQFVPYARVAGSAGGGKVTPEDMTYVWIRIFQDEATREQQYKIYQDKEGLGAVGPASEAGFEKAQIIIRAHPTSFSKLQ